MEEEALVAQTLKWQRKEKKGARKPTRGGKASRRAGGIVWMDELRVWSPSASLVRFARFPCFCRPLLPLVPRLSLRARAGDTIPPKCRPPATVNVEKLQRSNAVLRGRCLELFIQRTTLQARITELEEYISCTMISCNKQQPAESFSDC